MQPPAGSEIAVIGACGRIFEPACLLVRSRVLIHLSYVRVLERCWSRQRVLTPRHLVESQVSSLPLDDGGDWLPSHPPRRVEKPSVFEGKLRSPTCLPMGDDWMKSERRTGLTSRFNECALSR